MYRREIGLRAVETGAFGRGFGVMARPEPVRAVDAGIIGEPPPPSSTQDGKNAESSPASPSSTATSPITTEFVETAREGAKSIDVFSANAKDPVLV